jgi:apolipoprotein D and lipocalin family protein
MRSILSLLFVILLLNTVSTRARAQVISGPHNSDAQILVGEWFEIASIPNWYTRECVGTKVQYLLRSETQLEIKSSCHLRDRRLAKRSDRSIATITRDEPGKLNVNYFWPFSGEQWIIESLPDDDLVVLADPNRQKLWILSRRSSVPKELLIELIGRIESIHGFDSTKIQLTPQPRLILQP